MKRFLMASASVPVAAVPEAFDPLGWYGEVDAGWHVSAGTPCQAFSVVEPDFATMVDRKLSAALGIPRRVLNQQTNTIAAGEDRMAFWDTVLGQPYQIDMTLRGAERIDLDPALHAGL